LKKFIKYQDPKLFREDLTIKILKKFIHIYIAQKPQLTHVICYTHALQGLHWPKFLILAFDGVCEVFRGKNMITCYHDKMITLS
jgi:hypothetical protein